MLNIGESVGIYKIQAEVGGGDVGVVTRAADRQRHSVAIKWLKADCAPGSLALAAAQEQARQAAALGVPGIVPVLEWGEHQGQAYMVMPWMPGGSLETRLVTGRVPAPEAHRIITQIAAALDAAHAAGIVHGNIKPSNILFDAEGNAALSDFGSLSLAAACAASPITSLIGPPAYLSPEQARRDALDARSDVYMLGAVLFEMLTGCLPYESSTPLGFAAQHIASPVPSLWDVDPRLPGGASAAIQLSMAKDPAARIPSAGDLARVLGADLEPIEIPEAPLAPTVDARGAELHSLPSEERRLPEKQLKAPRQASAAPRQAPARHNTGWIWALAGLIPFLALVAYGVYGLGQVGIGPLAMLATATLTPTSTDIPLPTFTALPNGQESLAAGNTSPMQTEPATPTVIPRATGTLEPSPSPTTTPTITPTPTPIIPPTPLPTLGFTNPLTYTIQYNDTFFTIATQFHVDLGELLSVNDMRCNSQLAVSKLLIIPPAVEYAPLSFVPISIQTANDLKLLHVADCLSKVSVAKFSPDGRILAAATENFVYLWQVGDWKPLARLKGHASKVISLAFSDNGQMIATGSDDATVRLWQVKDGALLATLKGHTNSVTDVAFYPGSQTLVSTSRDQSVRIWRVDGSELQKIHGYPAFSAAFSPDGNTLAVGYADSVRLFRVSDLTQLQQIPSSQVVRHLIFSPDGQMLISNNNAWQLSDGREIYTFNNSGDGLALTSDGQLLFIGRTMFKISNGQRLRSLQSPVTESERTNNVWDTVALSPDNGLLAWGTQDGLFIFSLPLGYAPPPPSDQQTHVVAAGDNYINIAYQYQLKLNTLQSSNGLSCTNTPFLGQQLTIPAADNLPDPLNLPVIAAGNVTQLQEVRALDMQCILEPGRVAFSADSQMVIAGSAVWRVDTNSPVIQAADVPRNFDGTPDTGIASPVLVLSPDQKTLAIRIANRVELWDASTERPIRTLEGHAGNITALAFSLDGSLLISGAGSDDPTQTSRIWKVADGTLAGTLVGYTVRSMMALPDGDHLLVEGDNALRLWLLSTQRLISTLQGIIGAYAVSPDGALLAFDSCEKKVKDACVAHLTSIYHIAEGKVSVSLRGMTPDIQAIRFSPDGKTLAVASGYAVNVFRVDDWSLLQTLNVKNNLEYVREIEFSPDSSLLVSTADDSTIRFWQISDGALLHTLNRNIPNDMVFSPDGKLLALWNSGRIALWAVK